MNEVVGFMYFENLGLLDVLWLMCVSILTIGYGDRCGNKI
ncbi:ion channel [Sporosarcina ureae]